jgi:predicted ATP-dependent protease
MRYEESREDLKKKSKASPILLELEAHEQAELLPVFRYNQPLFQTPNNPGFFDLSSHARARAAMDFAFKVRGKQFHVVVIGEDRSGRVSSTLTYLEAQAKKMKRPCDWVYLNNFFQTYKPLPYPLPHGMGKYLKEQLSLLITNVDTFINQLLNSPSYLNIVETLSAQLQFEIDAGYKKLVIEAEERGFRLEQTEQGLNIEPLDDQNSFSVKDLAALREKLTNATLTANFSQQKMDNKISNFKKENLQKALIPLFMDFRAKFEPYLKSWLISLEEDILSNLDLFLNDEELGAPSVNPQIKERYAVNLFVDNTYVKHPKVILVNNPTYENIFGSIQYVTNGQNGMIETNFTMVKPGALHHANGGFLMIRAENLAQDPDLWQALKAALRDNLIRIQEKHRDNTFPILDAPKPRAIPLDVQVFLITSPTTYYSFLQYDPEFSAYFKIKAEIDSDMSRTPENVKAYHALLTYCTKRHHGHSISRAALNMLTDYASKKTGSTKKLTAQFELILDILDQAVALDPHKKHLNVYSIQKIQKLIAHRHSRFEEEIYEQLLSQTLLIETEGAKVGQINGLTVLTMGDHEFGMP